MMTVEGLMQDGKLHPLQEGFKEEHGLQCGFCTPGMLMSSYALLQKNPTPAEEEIRWGISGNLCRCTGYQNIVKAVQFASKKMDARRQNNGMEKTNPVWIRTDEPRNRRHGPPDEAQGRSRVSSRARATMWTMCNLPDMVYGHIVRSPYAHARH